MIEFGFENAKEIFNHSVVIAIFVSRHALSDPFITERFLVERHLVLPPLV